MYKFKFDLLFEEIMKTKISVNTFDFNFIPQDNGDIICEFDTLNSDNKLINVKANIKANGTIEFDLIDNNITNTLDEKTFMLKYYKDYEQFKEAYKNYQTETDKDKQNDKNTSTNSSSKLNNDNIPKVKMFDDKLNALTVKNKGITLKSNGQQFVIRYVNDDIKNLIQINFDLINNEPRENELPEYDVICLVKLLNNNSVISKFIMKNPNNLDEKEEWEKSKFKERFPDIFNNVYNVIDQFEKTI